ncbi:MAG: SDR family oxidoreductase [Candidatus Acidiferrales bacterium]
MANHQIFITGSTGLMGTHLIPSLLTHGHSVRALVRPGSESKLPPGCISIPGNPLDASTYQAHISPADTFIHLIGVSHPSPAKAAQFRSVDLKSVEEAAQAARVAGIRHFIYLSVAHPAPVMKAYIAARSEGEALLRASGMDATFVRPWYVLGPGRRWPLALMPVYWLLEQFPSTRESARRLGLVSIDQMVATLASAVENPPPGDSHYRNASNPERFRSLNQFKRFCHGQIRRSS